VPARALDRVDLSTLYALVESEGYRPGELPANEDDALERLLAEIEAERRQRMRTSVGELLDT
jgi:hypothetical protein